MILTKKDITIVFDLMRESERDRERLSVSESESESKSKRERECSGHI